MPFVPTAIFWCFLILFFNPSMYDKPLTSYNSDPERLFQSAGNTDESTVVSFVGFFPRFLVSCLYAISILSPNMVWVEFWQFSSIFFSQWLKVSFRIVLMLFCSFSYIVPLVTRHPGRVELCSGTRCETFFLSSMEAHSIWISSVVSGSVDSCFSRSVWNPVCWCQPISFWYFSLGSSVSFSVPSPPPSIRV